MPWLAPESRVPMLRLVTPPPSRPSSSSLGAPWKSGVCKRGMARTVPRQLLRSQGETTLTSWGVAMPCHVAPHDIEPHNDQRGTDCRPLHPWPVSFWRRVSCQLPPFPILGQGAVCSSDGQCVVVNPPALHLSSCLSIPGSQHLWYHGMPHACAWPASATTRMTTDSPSTAPRP